MLFNTKYAVSSSFSASAGVRILSRIALRIQIWSHILFVDGNTLMVSVMRTEMLKSLRYLCSLVSSPLRLFAPIRSNTILF